MMYVEPVGKLAMVGAGLYLVYYWYLGKGSELLQLRADELGLPLPTLTLF